MTTLFRVRWGTVVAAVLFVFALSSVSTAQEDPTNANPASDPTDPTLTAHPETDMTLAEATELLRGTGQFADTAIGVAGITPDQLHAWHTIMDSPDADSVLKGLLEEASVAGQLYALCGLYFTDPPYFVERIEPYRTMDVSINVAFGCMLDEMPVKDIVEQRDGCRLTGPDQSLTDWSLANPGVTMILDIFGGGYPTAFRTDIARVP